MAVPEKAGTIARKLSGQILFVQWVFDRKKRANVRKTDRERKKERRMRGEGKKSERWSFRRFSERQLDTFPTFYEPFSSI